MKFPWTLARERREHARWLEREKSWWSFQARMDFLYGKISQDEWDTARDQIRQGIEYVGWARRR